MTANDKCGVGAGLLALGLAGGIILVMQYMPDMFGLPTREVITVEAVFDAILLVTCLPAGIYLLYKGAFSGDGTKQK
jgi:hypothetical protein